MTRAITLAAFFVAALSTLGCGCPGEFPVSGTVTWNGQPIPKGQIFFDPDLAKKNDGVQGYALIDNGKFDTRTNGRGIVGGSYIIRVAGFDGKPGAELPLGKPLFPEIRVEWEFPRQQCSIDLALPVKKPAAR